MTEAETRPGDHTEGLRVDREESEVEVVWVAEERGAANEGSVWWWCSVLP